jgi:hypothetical protein
MSMVIVVIVLSAALVAVAWPLVRPELAAMESDAGPASHMAVLEERKLSIYGAIRDLGFDYRTDKITEDDYQREMATLKAEAVAVLREMETLRSSPPRGTEALEREIESARQGGAAVPSGSPSGEARRFCTQCGEAAAGDDRFCANCGATLRKSG